MCQGAGTFARRCAGPSSQIKVGGHRPCSQGASVGSPWLRLRRSGPLVWSPAAWHHGPLAGAANLASRQIGPVSDAPSDAPRRSAEPRAGGRAGGRAGAVGVPLARARGRPGLGPWPRRGRCPRGPCRPGMAPAGCCARRGPGCPAQHRPRAGPRKPPRPGSFDTEASAS